MTRKWTKVGKGHYVSSDGYMAVDHGHSGSDRRWQMGQPIDDTDAASPMIAGTVTFHPSLAKCKAQLCIRDRAKRFARNVAAGVLVPNDP